MKLTPAIQWHDGMMLMPQHFQQLDRRVGGMMSFYLKYLAPYFWGVIDMTFDPQGIPEGVIKLTHITAITPDGVIIQRDGDFPVPISLTLLPDAGSTLTIYLALPEVKPTLGQGLPRYVAADSPGIVDVHNPESQVHIPSLYPNVQLIADVTPPVGYISMPLFKMYYVDGAWGIAQNYYPPMVTLDADHPLIVAAQEVLAHMKSRLFALYERINSATLSTLNAEHEKIVTLLNSALPPIEAILTQPMIRPQDLFIELARLAGTLTAIQPTVMMTARPVYQHDDLQACMMPLIQHIEKMLRAIDMRYTIVPFNKSDRLFQIRLDTDFDMDWVVVGFRAGLGMSDQDLFDWVGEAVIASESFVQAIRDKRIVGAPRTLIDEEPQIGLIPGRGVQIYRVQLDPSVIRRGERLVIFNLAERPGKHPREVILYMPTAMDAPTSGDGNEAVA